MNTYHIWDGGYTATGEHAGPSFHATVKGETFEAACRDYFTNHPDPDAKRYYNPKTNTLWGMTLYPGEEPRYA